MPTISARKPRCWDRAKPKERNDQKKSQVRNNLEGEGGSGVCEAIIIGPMDGAVFPPILLHCQTPQSKLF